MNISVCIKNVHLIGIYFHGSGQIYSTMFRQAQLKNSFQCQDSKSSKIEEELDIIPNRAKNKEEFDRIFIILSFQKNQNPLLNSIF